MGHLLKMDDKEDDWSTILDSPKEFQWYVDTLRKELIVLKDYPNVMLCLNTAMIDSYGIKNEKELIEPVRRLYVDEELYIRYTHVTDNAVFVCRTFPFYENYILLFIFYKDFEAVKKQMSSVDMTYDVGTYYVKKSPSGYFLKEISLKEDIEPVLNDDFLGKIKKDIDTFFAKRDFYDEHKMPFKRGILLYGSPGNGKTSTIRAVLRQHPGMHGIIMNAKDVDSDFATTLKEMIGDKPKILVFEDIDGMESWDRSILLNFLDGVNVLENTFIIATTNHIQKVDSALVNRPSRFDRIYKIDLPDNNARRKLLVQFFPVLGDEMCKGDLDKYVKMTDGFTGAYFKELFIFKNIQDCSLDDAIRQLVEQLKQFTDDMDEKDSYMG